MTDTSEAMKLSQGDEITIMRGKHKGQIGKVLDVDKTSETYAVKFSDGSFAPINAVNVRVPDAVTITAEALGQALSNEGGELSDTCMARLEAAAPGITEHIVRAYASAE
jgi:KOW motif-containing protein